MCFLPSLTASSVLRGVGAQGSSKNAEGGGDCHTPVPGELWEALHQAPSMGLAFEPRSGQCRPPHGRCGQYRLWATVLGRPRGIQGPAACAQVASLSTGAPV